MQLDDILKIQDGVITMKQARKCGLSKDAVIRRVRSGQWEVQFKGVYQSTAHRRSHVTRFRAALLSAGEDAVAHGKSAAWWHGLTDTAPLRHSITIPLKRSIRQPKLDLRRRDLKSVDIDDVRGALVTGVELSVLEAGDSVLMDQALQTRTSIAKLETAYARNRHCAGAAEAGRLLKVAKSGGRSEAERLTHRILKPVPGWTAQVSVAGRYLDVGFEATKVGLEIDGWRWHKDSQRHTKDLQRHNALTLAGWTILRFDWHRLDCDPEGVLNEVLAAVRGRRAS